MAATRLPDGRTLEIDGTVSGRVSCGALVFARITDGAPEPLAAEIAALEAALCGRYAGQEPSRIEALRPARDLYKSFGMDPSRHRPSSEALLRRVLQGKGLYRLGNVVDACNLCSLGFLLPIGLYDLGKVRGDVELRAGLPGEQYAGIRKETVHVGGRLALFDRDGPFGSPTSDSQRTCTDGETRSVLAVVIATADYPAALMSAHLDRMSAVYARHCGADRTWRAWLGPEGAS